NFSLKSGSILGLVGQNGAGKSTLMKILAGVYLRDNGIIEIDNSEVVYNSPKEAIEYGIITIHQELSLTPNLSIAENIFLGDMSENKLGFVRLNSLYKKAESLLSEMGVNLNPRNLVKNIPISQQQLVEIAKAYRRKPKILILDEPTSSLNINEKKSLYRVMNNLKKKNTAMIFISHHLDEITELCDDVLVLRDGNVANFVAT